MWPNSTKALSANSIIKKAVTEPLKLRRVASGMNGDMKNINRYTNEMPTGRISEAVKGHKAEPSLDLSLVLDLTSFK